MIKDLHPIVRSASAHARLKLACLAGLGLWMAAFYFAPQQWPFFADNPAPELAFDEWVPFGAHWALFYQSLFVVHALAVMLPAEAEAVRAYCRDVALAYAAASVVFWIYPTLSPRPVEVDAALYRWLIVEVDGLRNAFPSLHAALATLSACYLWRHLQNAGASKLWAVALALWWVTLLYSTLATRQHRLLDVVAGTALVGIISVLIRRFRELK